MRTYSSGKPFANLDYRRFHRMGRLAVLFVLITILGILLPAQSALAAPKVLHGHVPAAAAGLRPIRALEANRQLHLAIGLPLHNQEALTNLLQELYDPASPNFHHYLTPDQFTAMFGPTTNDYQVVIDFARSKGLAITGTFSNRMLVDVSGGVREIENAFGVTMLEYQHPMESRTFFAPSVEPSVPSTVPILDISGLNDFYHPHPNSRLKPINQITPDAGSGPGGAYMGSDFRKAYMPGVTLNGSGQTVALVQFDGYYANDIAAYVNQAGISLTVPLQQLLQNVPVDGGVAIGPNNLEVAMDIEMLVSMAPGLSKIMVYEAPNGAYTYDLLNQIATDNSARQISCSWGIGSGGALEQIFLQFASQGQSFFQASGDGGNYYGGPEPVGDDPNVTSVGGTTLVTDANGAWQAESVWKWPWSFHSDAAASEGGISGSVSIPSWQQGISVAVNKGSTTMRNFPDVALTADGVWVIYGNGASVSSGGTSAAAPLWAGVAALINQQCAANGLPPVGFLNPAIYSIGRRAIYSSCFHDIQTGNNNLWQVNGQSPYTAVAGYDLCTGWGTPNGQNLINALATPPAPNLSAQAGNNHVALSWNSVTGVASYNVQRSAANGGPYTIIANVTGTAYTDSTVVNNATYYYVVSGVYNGVETANSSQVGPLVPEPVPATPTGFNAQPGFNQVTLNWSGVSGATFYNVKRSTTSGGPYLLIASPTGTSYTDTTAENGKGYYYVVSAVNVDVESPNSSQIGQVTPALPAGLSALAGNHQVALGWYPVTGASSYKLKRSVISGGSYTTIASPTGTNFTDSTAINGTAYYYVLSAVLNGFETVNCNPIGPVTPEPPLSAPTGLSAQAGANRVVLTWNSVSGASSYNIQCSIFSGGPYTTVGTSTGLRFTDTAAAGGVPYYYVVSAVNVDVLGSVSSPVGPVTPTGAGTWAYTSSFPYPPHQDATATLLPNGLVLVAGGASATADLYNSITRQWASQGAIGSMLNSREGATATLLPNGLVLFAGGGTASAELFDPGTGQWKPTASMHESRNYATATLLPKGYVLVVGGGTASAEVYDPNTDQWTPTTSMLDARDYATATLLPNGTVLVAGGQGSGGSLASAEVYNPATGYWTPTSLMNNAHAFATATLLPNGSVLVAGGLGANSSSVATAELYNPANGQWTSANPMNNARLDATATLLPNGLVLVAGGINLNGYVYLPNAELYNPATGGWTPTGSLNAARAQHTATLLPNGTVFVAGGVDGNGDLTSAELFDAVTPGSTPVAPTGLSATPGDHQVVLNWNSVSGATYYNVKRSTASGGPFLTIASPLGTTGCTDTTAVNGTAYYYVISAVNLNTEGPNSSQVGPLTPEPVPAAPTGLTAKAGNNQVLLSWNSVSGATYYNVKRSTISGGSYTTIASPAGTLFADTTAGNGTTYYYVVSAVNVDVESLSNSGQVSAKPGAWLNTGSLSYGSESQTATLLPSGLVLIAGGTGSYGVQSTAQLYNPATGQWTLPYSMNDARAFATATLLPNGLVLVAGGQGSSGSLASAELYNPATGYWTPTGSMNNARAYATATLLPNGLVLVTGGYGASGSSLASAELYNPATGQWTATGSMNNARYTHTATLLPNGLVLVAGGLPTSGSCVASAELYNPATGSWTQITSMNNPRAFATATLLPNGSVLVAGGFNSSYQGLASAELYNPATGSWTTTGSMNNARTYATATLLPNGLVLVAGGASSYDSGGIASTELYNPATGQWALTTPMNYGRYWATATLLPNGSVLFAGGVDSNGYVLTSTELYNPVPLTGAGQWSGTGSLNTARIYQTATLLPNGLVLVAGGNNESGGVLASAEVYNPANGQFTLDSYSMNHARQYATATLLPNGLVLVAGGDDGTQPIATAELYNPATGQWTATGSMSNAREYATATLLPNGLVLVTGGFGSSWQSLTSSELYNPATGTWTATGSLNNGREWHTATLLPNGLVLVAGGMGASFQGLTSAELYNPANGTWTATGSLTSVREFHTATLLPNGLVLVAGGEPAYDASAVATAELYNPATGQWTATGSMKNAREQAMATLLPNGLVLVASGSSSTSTGGNSITSAELYNPATGTWSVTGSLFYPAITATLLPNGLVLAAGGYPYAELYTPYVP